MYLSWGNKSIPQAFNQNAGLSHLTKSYFSIAPKLQTFFFVVVKFSAKLSSPFVPVPLFSPFGLELLPSRILIRLDGASAD